MPNPGLLEENTFLVEYPSVVVGNFEDKFLALPDEVLITSMREHQRYFSLSGADGTPAAPFHRGEQHPDPGPQRGAPGP